MNTRVKARAEKKLREEARETLIRTGRPPICTKIKRDVRKRCGFGCVICGMPLYEYEHMEEWAIVKRHVADEITLLCNQHHREKTNGLLSVAAVRKANSDPINRRGTSSSYPFHAQPATLTINVGNNIFYYKSDLPSSGFIVISISAEPILWFTFDGYYLLLNISLFDNENKLILEIRDNELIYSTELWDVTFIGKTLTIKTASRETALVLTVSPNEKIIHIQKAKFYSNGLCIDVNEDGIPNVKRSIFPTSGHAINYGEKKNTKPAIQLSR
jgi:hypothetical protein